MLSLRHHVRVVFALAVVSFMTSGVMRAQFAGADLNGAARLMSFTGQISVLRDGNPWALNLGDMVRPQQVIVTGSDGYGVFQVSDGSTFEVFPK